MRTTANQAQGLTRLIAAMSSNMLAGYEEVFPDRYIATIEGDGGLSLSKWEPRLQHHKVFGNLQAGSEWIHASLNDDWRAGAVIDTHRGIVVASSGMPVPFGAENDRVVCLVRDWWVGDY